MSTDISPSSLLSLKNGSFGEDSLRVMNGGTGNEGGSGGNGG